MQQQEQHWMQSSGEHDGNNPQVGVASHMQMLSAAHEPRGISVAA